MKNIFKGIGTLFMLAVMIAMTAAACGDDPKAPQVDPQVSNYGNGVFYFPYKTAHGFGNALSIWREYHKWDAGCQILSVAADDTYGYGSTTGYFVITNPSCEAK